MRKKKRRNRGQKSSSRDTPAKPVQDKSVDDITPILMPITDVCKLLALSRSTLDRLGDDIPGRRRIGGKIMYYLPELQNWLKDARR